MKYNTKFIGAQFKKRRTEMNLKQKELAERIGISNTHLSSIEGGIEAPSLATFIALCTELNVTPDFILLGNMRTNGIPRDIYEMLRLCREEDLYIIKTIVKMYVDLANSSSNLE